VHHAIHSGWNALVIALVVEKKLKESAKIT